MKKYGHKIPCFRCGEEKPRSEYHRSRLLALCPICKDCANAYCREWRAKNPEVTQRHNRKRREIRAERSYEEFPAWIHCRGCGENKSRMDFYLSALGRGNYLCKSCHNKKTNERRRIKRGLPPKPPRLRLPDWSSY